MIGPTEIRILVVIVNTILIFWNPTVLVLNNQPWKVVDVVGAILAGVFVIVFCIVGIKDAIKLDRLDRAKWEK
jgi:branched-subunit amino acid permease